MERDCWKTKRSLFGCSRWNVAKVRAACTVMACSTTCSFVTPGIAGECLNAPFSPPPPGLLYSYAQAVPDRDEYYSIAATGNEYLALSPDGKPILASDMAAMIRRDHKFKNTKFIVLDWPFSRRGTAPYATKLERLLGKPVLGYSGPVWFYSDGILISSRNESATLKTLSADDVAECSTSDGTYHRGNECRLTAKAHLGLPAVFGNAAYVLNCDDIRKLSQLSLDGDRGASYRLFYYYAFVERDSDMERTYGVRASAELWRELQ